MSSTDQLVAAVWRRRFTFLLAFACVLGGVAAVTYSLPKKYSTHSYLIVDTVKPVTNDFEAQQVSQVDTQTTAELLQTRNTANEVASGLPYRATGKEVQGRVSISPVANTLLVLITATESTPLRAQQLANTYATVFEQRTAPTIAFARVNLGESAPLITDPSSPHTHLYLLVGAILAALAGIGAAVLRERLDRTVRIDEFQTELFGLPILARVPQVRVRPGRLFRTEPDTSRVIEALRWVFAHLAFVNEGARPRSIAIVSAAEQEGKSTVCVSLGHVAEDTLRGRVLLVDADLRRPSLAEWLVIGTYTSEGLSTYLADPRGGDFSRTMAEHHHSRLTIVPAGPIPPSPTSLLGLPRFAEFVEQAEREFECVVFDTSPIRAGADASLIAAAADGAVLVVDARSINAPSVHWSVDQLRRAHVNLLGVILNRVSGTGDLAYYYSGPASGRRRGRSRKTAVMSGAPAVDGAAGSATSTVSTE
jgi:polysaccharide biosynthesis transport protein